MGGKSEFQLVTSRLAAIERQNRRLRSGLVALACSMTLCVSVGFQASEPAKVVATDFQLVDGNGQRHAQLGFDNKGPVLRFFDSKNRDRISLRLRDNEPVFVIADGGKKTRVAIAADREKTSIALYDRKQKPLWYAPAIP
jgi:hypothetical protein